MAKTRDVAAYVAESRLKLQSACAALPIFQQAREQALYHYCAVLEVEAYKAEASQEKVFSVGSLAPIRRTSQRLMMMN